MKYPNLHSAEKLIHSENWELACINGQWVRVRPLGYPSFLNRFKLAWNVLIGKYDAIKWVNQ